VTYGGDPFGQQFGDPFSPASSGPPPTSGGYGAPGFPPPGQQPPLNTFAVLAPIFGVLIPPAGVAFGHLALPQIKRTGQRGHLSAVAGLVLGYLLTVALVVGLILFALLGGDDDDATVTPTTTAAATPAPTKTVTSMAPPPTRKRDKINLEAATVGMCVEIQSRDTGADALDLFEVECEQRDGVYTVVKRVAASSDCNTTYAAAPPNRAFAVCLNKY
jgi:hypothetical protein